MRPTVLFAVCLLQAHALHVPGSVGVRRPSLGGARAQVASVAPATNDETDELIIVPELAASAPPATSVTTATINLAKNIICGGFLSLPAGVACCSLTPTARTLLPASAATLCIGALSAYCFALIGRTCALERQPTYHGAWSTSVGARSGKLVKASLAAKTGVTCLSYSMILADMAAQLSGVGRTVALMRVTAAALHARHHQDLR